MEKPIIEIYNDAVLFGASNVETLDKLALKRLYDYVQSKLNEFGAMDNNIHSKFTIPNEKNHNYDQIQNLISLIIKAQIKFN